MRQPTTAEKMLKEEFGKVRAENRLLRAELEYTNKAIRDIRERYIKFLDTTNKDLDLILNKGKRGG